MDNDSTSMAENLVKIGLKFDSDLIGAYTNDPLTESIEIDLEVVGEDYSGTPVESVLFVGLDDTKSNDDSSHTLLNEISKKRDLSTLK